MGGAWSSWSVPSIISYFVPNRDCKLIMVGLDGSGKPSALYKMILDLDFCQATPIPTKGYNGESLTMHSVSFDVWDVGGPAIERGFWRLFLVGGDAVILVIDSTDHVRMPEAEQALNELLAAPELEKAPLLILANKQDLDDAMGVAETEALSLQKVTSHDWQMQSCCAVSGDGLAEGFGWISEQVSRHPQHGSG